MSWTDIQPGAPIQASPSPLESQRFGLPISRLNVPLGAHDDELAGVIDAIRKDESDVVFLRYPASHLDWFSRLRTSGRDLILADSMTYWRLDSGKVDGRWRPSRPDGLEVISVPDAGEVADFIGGIFATYSNHYASNPLLGRAEALAGYQEWARTTVTEFPAVALADDSGVVALMTIEVTDGVGEIVLGGVRADRMGAGLYGVILDVAIDEIRRLRAETIVLSTQGHNIAVQRAWGRVGFLPIGELFTVHAVRPGLLP
jgi:hypothetical protein